MNQNQLGYNLSALPLYERADCPVCRRHASASAGTVCVVSGVATVIGKDKEKNNLLHREPTLRHNAPVCWECNEGGVRKVRNRRPINCILSILSWPVGVGLIIAALVIAFSDGFGIRIGNWIVVPWIFILAMCIPGIAVICLAVHTGSRGFTDPQKRFILDVEEKLKTQVLDEFNKINEGIHGITAFTATLKEASHLHTQNANAQIACKYPAQ